MTRTELHRGDDASPSRHRGRPALRALAAALALLLDGSPAAAAPAAADGIAATEVEFSAFQDQAFVAARKSGSPVAIYFEADWCAPCREMHDKTFRAPVVLEAAAGIRFFRVDVTRPDHEVDVLKKSFHVFGTPTLILFGPDGKESGRRFGFIPPDVCAKMLDASRKPAQSS